MTTVVFSVGVAAALAVIGWGARRIRRLSREVAMLEAARAESISEIAASRDLLAAAIEAAPTATLILDQEGRVRYVSQRAQALFFQGAVPRNASISEVVKSAPAPLVRALAGDRNEVMVLESDGEREVFLVAKHLFTAPDRGPWTVLTVNPLTDAIAREEVAAYRKVLRVLGHELNNSLAPVASLVATGQALLASRQLDDLPRMLDTIAGRVEHLRSFLSQYSAIARLPRPRPRLMPIDASLSRIATLYPGVRIRGSDEPVFVDGAQLEQLLVNLVKNSVEAGSGLAEIEIEVAIGEQGRLQLAVRDRGAGLSDEALAGALVPFYSTKPDGAGLGLTLCREIVEAHGGRMRLRKRSDGGAEVLVRLPGPSGDDVSSLSFAMTRG